MIRISSEAKEDLKQFKLETREELLDKIEEKLDGDRDRENISYINKPQFGIEFHRLKLTEDGLSHRIYFDYIDSELTVFAVRHREHAYTPEDLEEVEQRLKNMEK